MAVDLWLPNGYGLDEGIKVGKMLYSGDDWQIYKTSSGDNVLLALPELEKKWRDFGFISTSIFHDVIFGSALYRWLYVHKKYTLAPIASLDRPISKVDAIAFSQALKASRIISHDVSFHDALYLEQYSRLLPTWSLTPRIDDTLLLGTWISGGVMVSSESFRRLGSLTGWMPKDDLAEIIRAAGLSVPAEFSILTKTNRRQDSEADVLREKSNELSDCKPVDQRPKTYTLPGREALESFFNDHVIDIITNPEKYRALGIDFPAPIILHGPPGCGKTFAVERLIEFIDWPSFSIDSNSVGSPYIHETSKKISKVFEQAIEAAPSVLVIDEMESFLSDRQSGSASGLHHVEEVAEFLRRIPEAIKKNVLIIAMTNMIEVIDPAILRRGRFDHIIEVSMPSRIEVEALLESLLSKLPKVSDLNLAPLLDVMTGKPLSDSAFIVREAARIAAKANKQGLDQESLLFAMKSILGIQGNKKNSIGFV